MATKVKFIKTPEEELVNTPIENGSILFTTNSGQIYVDNENIRKPFCRNYNILDNKPLVNGIELVGNKSLEDLGINTDVSVVEQFAIKPTVQGNNITLNDSTEYRVYENKLFGKSTQTGVPSPINKIPIVSISGNINQIFTNKNLLKNEFTGTKTVNGITFTLRQDGGIHVKGKRVGDSSSIELLGTKATYKTPRLKLTKEYKTQTNPNLKLVAITTENVFSEVINISALKNKNIGCVYLGVTTADNIDEVFYPQVYYSQNGDTQIGFIKNEQTELNITLTEEMRGIKVNSGGNYIDEIGQHWLCDTIEYLDNVGEFIKRTHRQIVPVDSVTKSSAGDKFILNEKFLEKSIIKVNDYCPCVLSNHFKQGLTTNHSSNEVCLTKTGFLVFTYDQNKTIEEFRETFRDKLEIIYPLQIPTITPLSKEQVEKLKKTKTYYPTTNIYNLQEVGQEITYFADTKNYIDGQIKKQANVISKILANTMSILPKDIQSKMIQNDIDEKFKEITQ